MCYAIKAKQIFLEHEIVQDAAVLVTGDRITGIQKDYTDCESYETIELLNLRLLPGLIDIHTHGGNHVEANDATKEAVEKLASYKLTEGVTSFCPTTTTAAMDLLKKAVAVIGAVKKENKGGAKIIGSYVEGPYICKRYKGAHPAAYIQMLTIDEIQELITASEHTVAAFTIAPELPGAMETISFLRSQGIVPTIGHTDASCEEVNQAIHCGAGLATHTYNAMRPMTHRDPGTVGAVLTNDSIFCELIFDNVHVAVTAAEVLRRCKGKNKIVLITDEMRAGGLPDGMYHLGEIQTIVKNKVARTVEGVLAGSTLQMNTAVANMVNLLHCPPLEAVNMASINPATALGLQNEIGSIAVSKRADLIGVDEHYGVGFVMVDGKPVWKKG